MSLSTTEQIQTATRQHVTTMLDEVRGMLRSPDAEWTAIAETLALTADYVRGQIEASRRAMHE